MSEEEKCAELSYIYGGITLSPKPPPKFGVAIRVDVGYMQAAVNGPIEGKDHLLWQYLAIVKPELVRITCTLGNISVTKQVEAKAGELNIVNFCFGKPVISHPLSTKFIEGEKRKPKKERGKIDQRV
ncbi:MAG: hypothetical protein QXX95_00645 [Nitrososphaerales archaeon]